MVENTKARTLTALAKMKKIKEYIEPILVIVLIGVGQAIKLLF